jgi:hypothetical protein
MDRPATCPECGSSELRETERRLGDATVIKPLVCGVCHWASDPRLGRPPADRSKNITLRRLMSDLASAPDDDPATDGG